MDSTSCFVMKRLHLYVAASLFCRYSARLRSRGCGCLRPMQIWQRLLTNWRPLERNLL